MEVEMKVRWQWLEVVQRLFIRNSPDVKRTDRAVQMIDRKNAEATKQVMQALDDFHGHYSNGVTLKVFKATDD